eukprot:CAMPEP_0114466504 /NCGR_PEP_ID=MMETSP0104-20121206/9103_1 /TAXON_ID=37642 ORGANISM="Paraphysomonas imperforata, Strain PA2" /NCGR_SAMPLE_ID=MMETSP0104 /ASSEMBLY_ACC=CAM_ASM_000202 /LENGTH=251 /DNA_ID=CAMNT_0001639865 /DNA_START=136 /DNA_END=891 /DNA_ORIENTATION=+
MTTPGAASRAQSPRQEHLVSMFGESLYHWAPAAEGNEKISQVDTLAALRTNKTLGVYFSGSWCGPCQAFTPKLAKFYEVLKKKSQEFEVVWISHDHSSDDFVRYFQQMPWLALAADRVAVQGARLAEQFGVQGIPALVLLDASDPHGACSVIALDGVDKVSRDPYALEFPYKPRLSALKALVPRRLRNFVSRKKDSGVAQFKGAFRGLAKAVSPLNIVRLILQVLRAALGQVISLVFPKYTSSKATLDRDL